MAKKLLLLIVALLVCGAVYFFLIKADTHQNNRFEKKQPVATLKLQRQAITLTTTLPGRISAYKQSQVRPQVNGIITRRLFKEGSYVRRGTQLYQIDDARYKAALQSAKADLQSARATIQSVRAKKRRFSELVQLEAVSKQEYDDVIAEYNQARAAIAVATAAVDVAKVNFEYTKVYAPISGAIGRSLVTAGTLVTANQAGPLAVITQLDPIYVDMQQSGDDALSIRSKIAKLSSVPVRVLLGDGGDQVYSHTGVLEFSEVTVDESTGSIILRASLPNPDRILLPGLFVRSELNLGREQTILVPQRATIRTPEGHLKAWIVDQEQRAQPRDLKAVRAYGDYWAVDSGVEEGDVLIVEGYQKVFAGALVTGTPWQDSELSNVSQSKHSSTAN